MMTEQQIVRKYLGIPYQHKGRELTGLDCYGLIICIYRDLGFKVWDIDEDYDREWAWNGRNHFAENYFREWQKVDWPALFDVVLFKNSKGIANHGGVVLNDFRFMHASSSLNVIISGYAERKWAPRVEGFYHLKAKI